MELLGLPPAVVEGAGAFDGCVAAEGALAGFVVADGLLVALEEAGCGEEGGLCAPIPGFAAFAGAGSGAASGAGLTALPPEAAGEAALLLDEAGEADGTEEGVDDWPGLEVDVPDHEDAGAGADAGSRGAFSYELVTLPVAAPEPRPYPSIPTLSFDFLSTQYWYPFGERVFSPNPFAAEKALNPPIRMR